MLHPFVVYPYAAFCCSAALADYLGRLAGSRSWQLSTDDATVGVEANVLSPRHPSVSRRTSAFDPSMPSHALNALPHDASLSNIDWDNLYGRAANGSTDVKSDRRRAAAADAPVERLNDSPSLPSRPPPRPALFSSTYRPRTSTTALSSQPAMSCVLRDAARHSQAVSTDVAPTRLAARLQLPPATPHLARPAARGRPARDDPCRTRAHLGRAVGR